jgi:hypothetical protein
MIRALVRSLAAVSLLATPTFGHDGCEMPLPRFALPRFEIGMPIGSFEFGVSRPVHRHVFRLESERIWVEPIFESRVVGYDLCRRPIWRQVLVREGYWSYRTVEICLCGATIPR